MPAPRFYTRPPDIPKQNLRFAKGLGYYRAGDALAAAKARAARTVKAKTGASISPLGSLVTQLMAGLQSPAQIRQTATADVNSQISAANLALEHEMQSTRDDYYRQAQAAEGFSQALAGLAQRHAGAIERAYGAQAGALSSLGASLGGEMTGSENAALAASQADVNRMAPGGQVPTYVPTSEGAGTVGSIANEASARLGMTGGGYSDEAYGRLLAAGLEGRDIADRYRWQGLETRRDYLDKVAELQAKRPSLFSEALSSGQQSRNQQLATLISALSLQSGNLQDLAQNKLATQKFRHDVATDKQQHLIDLAQLGLARTKAQISALNAMGLDQHGNPLPGNYKDPRTGRIMELPSGTVIGPKGLPIKLVTPKGAKSATPPKLYDWNRVRGNMMNEGAKRLGIAADSKGKVERGWSLKNIKQYIRRYANDFRATFGDYPQLDAMINEVANTLYNQLQERKGKGGAATPAAGGGVKSF